VPAAIGRPPYLGHLGPETYTGSHIQTPEIIERMREPSRIAAQAIAETARHIAPGVTTDDLDAIAHEFMCDHGAYPSTLGYRGFPKSICTSVNEVICHGIPDGRPLEDGDLIKIDITCYKNGVHGDNCATFGCGTLDQASTDLMTRTQEAMNRGIKAVKPGRQLNVIGRVIEAYASRFGYGVVRDYTGHGVHTAFHSGLIILHHDEPSLNMVMEPGLTLTIEPMLTLGDYHSHVWDDGWTVVTNDFSRCAQFEQTLVVTDTGAEVLTVP
jgi:methionyl aminopeptidase